MHVVCETSPLYSSQNKSLGTYLFSIKPAIGGESETPSRIKACPKTGGQGGHCRREQPEPPLFKTLNAKCRSGTASFLHVSLSEPYDWYYSKRWSPILSKSFVYVGHRTVFDTLRVAGKEYSTVEFGKQQAISICNIQRGGHLMLLAINKARDGKLERFFSKFDKRRHGPYLHAGVVAYGRGGPSSFFGVCCRWTMLLLMVLNTRSTAIDGVLRYFETVL